MAGAEIKKGSEGGDEQKCGDGRSIKDVITCNWQLNSLDRYSGKIYEYMLKERRCWKLQHEFWQNPSFN